MLEIRGIKNVKKIMWYEIVPGMVLLGGVRINDQVPPELQDFPVLTPELLRRIQEKYHLLKTHEIVVAQCFPGANSRQVSQEIKRGSEQVNKINIFRKELAREKLNLFPGAALNVPVLDSAHVEKEYLIKDVYNSFTVPYIRMEAGWQVPSFLNRMELNLTIGDLLTNRINAKFNLPEDKEVLLHLVIDYSNSMHAGEKMEIVTAALNSFGRYISSFLFNTKIRCYAFSGECRPVNLPLGGREMKGEETNYAAFMKKVLHFKNKEVYNKVILFTDGEPSDQAEAMRLSRLFPKNRIDYTQVIIQTDRELRCEIDPAEAARRGVKIIDNAAVLPDGLPARQLSDRELQLKKERIFRGFTAFAGACSGNQVILKISELVKLVTVECYDRYLGLLTLSAMPENRTAAASVKPAETGKREQEKTASPAPKRVVAWKDWYKQKKEH